MPCFLKPGEKLVAVTPMNKDKKVRFVEPITSSSNIPKQTDSLKNQVSNKPLLPSTRVNTTTSASGSKPSGNTKKNRIMRPPSSNQKNKVEENPRKVKSSLNKTNFIFEPINNALVKHSVRNAKFEFICAICNECMFDANHDKFVLDYVHELPLKETTIAPVITPTSKLKVVQIIMRYLDFGCSKHMTGNRSQLINFVSKFLGTVRFGNDHIAKIMGYGDYQMGNVTISWTLRAYYEEVGISHQTFVDHSLQQNGVVERRNLTLVEVARIMFIFLKALCYPTNDGEDLEYLIHHHGVDPYVLTISARKKLVVSTGTPSTTTINQDEPSTSTSQTTEETPSPVIPLGVEEADHDIEVAHMDNNSSFEFQS
ncbi:integrase, catalytic region, zinc finger, CCHC-type containing protein [Tanacetum coccineum]|uniref:Integrase, catalytic region, zinc finger, CCHC-type containing protein n=1 Tax=Tanacetum coccineum TaxID=301880 RepID=A0ABQ5I1L9_9ASTR